ncbi:FHA domain-containing protein [Actinomycetospora sp.]|uniref:FHA domain-containing protein n=1 Tax=Actinomycetospora sp. TaxID=1872135 RepID=UPI002F40C4E6
MTGWTARVWADRDHYELVRARAEPGEGRFEVPGFPPEPVEFEIAMRGEEIRIGRRGVPDDDPSASSAEDHRPGIDLTGPPRDPGVSHLHAVLLAVGPDRWVVLDAGSTNGTSVNYAAERLEPGTAVPLGTGDSIHVGAWTTITVERR